MADLGLLLDYVGHLDEGLRRADNLTRAGELSQAVHAYLEVLEVDPDNPVARRQVGQVATAVRQFDNSAPGRRWLNRMRSVLFDPMERKRVFAIRSVVVTLLVFIAFMIGYVVGTNFGVTGNDDPIKPDVPPKAKTLDGK
jgi:hypothetical protein